MFDARPASPGSRQPPCCRICLLLIGGAAARRRPAALRAGRAALAADPARRARIAIAASTGHQLVHHVTNRPTVIRKNGHMSKVEITVLDGYGAGDTEAFGRLLAQVSSRAAPLTAERLRDVLRTSSTSILVARLDGEIVGMALLLTLMTLPETPATLRR